ncbi:AbrB/MazE/SpoVT family DNA-binding domain-containing protein [Sandaracinobacteroides hominis]|uniref:AbrB/MazE/SpoVT family DNA-binding domain-containing protein n=1 Tax=Sandaracinobacteroides hominis TaxID=2780086 RepID=UPI0018F72CE0|nr:AbrB/MazE/SpoVT family DNA-binding domain-containing protein [Sandaracinobacteroides hominis]
MQIARWGNSLAVRIPVDVARALGIKEGDDVDMKPGEDGTIILSMPGGREAILKKMDKLSRPLPENWKIDWDNENLRGPDMPGERN